MQRKHPGINLSISAISPAASASPQPKSALQKPITTFTSSQEFKKWSPSDHRQLELTRALVSIFASNPYIPHSLLDNPEFRNFLAIMQPAYTLPSRKTLIRKLLPERRAILHNNIIHLAESARAVSLTIDIWSSRQMRSFLGITGHFIHNGSLRTVMLACKRVRGRHTADTILQHYEEVIQTFNLTSKISHITTDNAANMKCAFGVKLAQQLSPESTDSDSDTDCFSDSDSDSSDTEDVTPLLDTEDLLQEIPDHESCFCHTEQLGINEAIKACDELDSAIAKCKAAAAHVHKSTVSSDKLEDEKRLLTAVNTRWYSTFYCVRSVLNVPREKLDALDLAKKLTTSDRKLLKEFIDIMDMFVEINRSMQAEKSVTGSLVIPAIRSIRVHLNTFKAKYLSSLISHLKQAVEKRLSRYETSTTYQRASLLDPRIKLDWATPEEAASAKDDITTLLSPLPTTEASSPPRKKSRLFLFKGQSASAQPHTSNTELEQYLEQPTLEESDDPLLFWNNNSTKYPQLVLLAEKHLHVPASSAPVERIFNVAGKILRPDRARMSDSSFECLMFKCNSSFM